MSDPFLVLLLLCSVLEGGESCKLHHLSFLPSGFHSALVKGETGKDERVGRGKTLGISVHFLWFQAVSPRVALSPPLFQFFLGRWGSRAFVTHVLPLSCQPYRWWELPDGLPHHLCLPFQPFQDLSSWLPVLKIPSELPDMGSAVWTETWLIEHYWPHPIKEETEG